MMDAVECSARMCFPSPMAGADAIVVKCETGDGRGEEAGNDETQEEQGDHAYSVASLGEGERRGLKFTTTDDELLLVCPCFTAVAGADMTVFFLVVNIIQHICTVLPHP
jgi:hypothetical protein